MHREDSKAPVAQSLRKNRQERGVGRRKRLPHADAQGFTNEWRGRFRLRTDFFTDPHGRGSVTLSKHAAFLPNRERKRLVFFSRFRECRVFRGLTELLGFFEVDVCRGEHILIAGYPNVQRRQKKNAQQHGCHQAADYDDSEGALGIRTYAVRKSGGQ